MKKTFSVLHEKALQYAQIFLKAESDLIEVLQEIDRCRGYRELGYKSLFEYSVRGLGLSESVTYNLISVARKALEVPLLQEKIRNQEITLSNARTIAPILNPENQEKWLHAAQELSKRDLEKEIARVHPEKAVREQVRPVSESVRELKMPISEELYEELKRVQDLLSSQTQKPASLQEALQAMTRLYLEKKDPLKKAERVLGKKTDSPAPVSPVPGQVKNPRFIPAKLEHAVRLRDQDRCTHQSQTGRCPERRWLEIHHIKPLSEGGETHFENLELLCRAHHQLGHHREARVS